MILIFDKAIHQRLVSSERNTIHHEILVTPEDVSKNFMSHMAHMDEPLGDGASIPFFILASKAKKLNNLNKSYHFFGEMG